MDLGIAGRRALIRGGSRGLGKITGQSLLIDGGSYPGTF
jgi:hypothetical protein